MLIILFQCVILAIVQTNSIININMAKNDIISKIYYDEAGYGSVKQTYLEARQKDPSIKYDDVKKWLYKEVEQKKQLKGYNSFIAKETKE